MKRWPSWSVSRRKIFDRLEAVANPGQVAELQQARKGIHVSQPVREYITRLVRTTRNHTSLRLGASPGALSI